MFRHKKSVHHGGTENTEFVIVEFMPIVWHNPTVEITYKLTQRDFFDSMIAHRNRSRRAKWSFRIMLSIALLAATIGIIVLVTQPTSQLSINAVILIALAISWALCKWTAPWWSARNQFRKQPSAQGPRILMLDSTGTHWRWDGGTADVEWKNVIRYLEGKNEFLLYSSPAAFNMIPKRAMSAEQLEELRSLLAKHVPESRRD